MKFRYTVQFASCINIGILGKNYILYKPLNLKDIFKKSIDLFTIF